MSFRPLFSRDRIWAGLLALAFIALSFILTAFILRRPVGPASVILAAVALILFISALWLLYRLWALHTLDYWVLRDAIHIHWNGEEVIIPLGDVESIQRADHIAFPARWPHWPEPWIGYDANTRVLAYATQPPAHSLAIHTPDTIYLVSPNDPDGFIAAFRARRDFGPARQLKPVIYLAPWREHWLLRDRWAQALLLGGWLLGLFLLGYTAWHYPQLPETIALRVDLRGNPALLSPRRAIFLIPGFTLLAGFFNAALGYALYPYRRFFAYLLWSTSVVLQIIGLYVVAQLIAQAVG